MKKAIIKIIGILVVITAILFTLASYTLDYAVHPANNDTHDYDYWFGRVYQKYPELEQWFDSLTTHQLLRDTFIVADDGLKRHAFILQHDSLATGSTVMVHGYTDNCVDMMRYYYMHYEVLHRNVIVPELYAHGKSEGEDIRFGWLDRLDCSQIWLPLAHQLWPSLTLVQHGLSMGGATTMMTSGEVFPDSLGIIGFIDDCGYTDTYSLFKVKMKDEFNLPSFPILNVADLISSFKYGWKPSTSSATAQLAKCQLPVFFIHGENDDYVPTSMVNECYDAKTTGYRELWIAPGSKHAQSIHDHWDKYCARCRSFINLCDSIHN